MSRRSKNKAPLPHAAAPATTANPAPPGKWTVPGICILLAAIVWVVFGQTLGFGFVNYDDPDYVYNNPEVTAGLTLHGVAWAFTHAHASNWHPVTWLSHMLDCQIYGLKPWGHHLTNVLLHAVSAILLFLALRQLTGALWRSAFVAAVFAIHPLHVESVAWVAERKDVLSGVFFMLTLWAYALHAQMPAARIRYFAVIVLFAAGLMCKPTLVTLPFVLLLLDYWPLQRFAQAADPRISGLIPKSLVMEKIPLFILSACSCAVTVLTQEANIGMVEKLSFPHQIGNALVSYMVYLEEMIYPAGLAVFYPHPAGHLPAWEVLLAIILLASISTSAFVLRRRRPFLVVGWLWYLGMLVPMIGLVQVGGQAHADRYTYLPQIGLYIAITWAAAEACAGLRHRRLLAAGASAMILGALMLCARTQTSYWKDDQTLWTHALAVVPDNALAENNLGSDLEKNGRNDDALADYRKAVEMDPTLILAQNNLASMLLRKGDLDEAIAHANAALEIDPDDAEAHNDLGSALLDKNQADEAIVHFQKALAIQPRLAKAHNNLGTALLQKGDLNEARDQYEKALKIDPGYAEAYYNLGNVSSKNGRPGEAIANYEKAVELKPDLAEAHYNLGITLQQNGRVAEAIPHLQKAVELQPDLEEAHYYLGYALHQEGCMKEAIAEYQNALQIQPDLPQAHSNLGAALLQMGDVDAALPHLQRALELQPGLSGALSNLGVALMRKGRYDEAITQLQRALEIRPGSAEIHFNLGLALQRSGRQDQAITHYQKALELQPNYPDAMNNLAYLLATCPQASLRNGAKALELALQADQAAGGNNPMVLRTLAAAYAETGLFPDAVETAKHALDVANSQSNAALAELLRSNIALYQARTPLRDNGPGKQ